MAEVQIRNFEFNMYEMSRMLGRGAFGEVKLYTLRKEIKESPYRPKSVAIKHMSVTAQEFTGPDITSVAARREMKFTLLSHPNVVKFFGGCVIQNQMCLVMEVCKLSLEQYLRNIKKRRKLLKLPRRPLLPDNHIQHWMGQLIQGLEYLHGKDILHRDLKPGNILMTYQEDISSANFKPITLKLGDFGCSREYDARLAQHRQMTITGTVDYMAPEVLMGQYDKSVDIYSLGVVLFEMFTGKILNSKSGLNLRLDLKLPLVHLVSKMTALFAEDRIPLIAAKGHPFLADLDFGRQIAPRQEGRFQSAPSHESPYAERRHQFRRVQSAPDSPDTAIEGASMLPNSNIRRGSIPGTDIRVNPFFKSNLVTFGAAIGPERSLLENARGKLSSTPLDAIQEGVLNLTDLTANQSRLAYVEEPYSSQRLYVLHQRGSLSAFNAQTGEKLSEISTSYQTNPRIEGFAVSRNYILVYKGDSKQSDAERYKEKLLLFTTGSSPKLVSSFHLHSSSDLDPFHRSAQTFLFVEDNLFLKGRFRTIRMFKINPLDHRVEKVKTIDLPEQVSFPDQYITMLAFYDNPNGQGRTLVAATPSGGITGLSWPKCDLLWRRSIPVGSGHLYHIHFAGSFLLGQVRYSEGRSGIFTLNLEERYSTPKRHLNVTVVCTMGNSVIYVNRPPELSLEEERSVTTMKIKAVEEFA